MSIRVKESRLECNPYPHLKPWFREPRVDFVAISNLSHTHSNHPSRKKFSSFFFFTSLKSMIVTAVPD